MKIAALALTSLALVSCDQRQPKLTDAQVGKLRAAEPGMTDECIEKARWGGIEAIPSETDKCFKLDPPRRFKGLFRYDFEMQRFCPEPATKCSSDTPGEIVWLSRNDDGWWPTPPHDLGKLYAIDFIGRKTTFPGHYGHMGVFDEEIIVERTIEVLEFPKDRKL